MENKIRELWNSGEHYEKFNETGEEYKPKFLELFAGSCHMAKAFKEAGFETFTIDIKQNAEGTVDLVADISQIKMTDIPFRPDVVWSGTPCTTYSIAAISHHRNGQEPISEFAKVCDQMNCNILEWIRDWDCDYFIENPRGMLRKMWFMKGLPRTTIWYCQYGDDRAKPTDIWSNNIHNPMFNPDGWKPRPPCRNYKYDKEGNPINKHCHHEDAVRSSTVRKLKEVGIKKTIGGTQGKADNYERSLYPQELIEDIVNCYAVKTA
jgi:hypothetical protein